ncbi:MAG: ribonuclease P protein component [Mycobacterium sp.]
MLSPSNRLTSPVHFREVVRRGQRCGGPLMVVHLLAPEVERAHPGAPAAPRVGLVVSKAVGPAVTRNKVARRLRHLARERTGSLPPHGMLVVRALPPAAHASYDELASELDRCLAKLGVSANLAATAEVGG